MASAFDSPIPDKDKSSSLVAVLIDIILFSFDDSVLFAFDVVLSFSLLVVLVFSSSFLIPFTDSIQVLLLTTSFLHFSINFTS